MEELQEWMMRAREDGIRLNTEAPELVPYNEELLEEYRNSNNEVYVMSEEVDDVSVSCEEDLTVTREQSNATVTWNFQVETERQLVHVALLKQEPGASFTLGDISSVACAYSPGKAFVSGDITYDFTVSFTSFNPGLYEQWLVLDFDMRPVLLKKLRVRVGQPLPLDDAEEPAADCEVTFQSGDRWHCGNRVVVPFSSWTRADEKLLNKYKTPEVGFQCSYSKNSPLTKDNYKTRMHQFLYNEERAEHEVVARLNVCGEVTTLDTLPSMQYDMMIASPGELYCAVSVPCNFTQDTPEGVVLRQSIQSGLIAPLAAGGPNSKVYEAMILPNKTEKKLYLQLSKKCCADLTLKSNTSYQMEVQFQMDRHKASFLHKAIDLLPDTERVLPDFQNCVIPENNIVCENLSAKQQAAVDFITGNPTVPNFVAPLLVYGPFGTGKTFTLAMAARELSRQPHNKVLICTHTNSSADLYVRNHFHPFINDRNDEMKPIRIKANSRGKALSATDWITLKYCLLSEDGQYFKTPTKAVLDSHKIIITTTLMAKCFHELKLREGYFTHILIDEASQMLECEALIPLSLAGPHTRVVLAGDHMQMAPKLFSVDDHHRSNHTLLTRLFYHYQGQNCPAAQASRIIFNENYRSTKEIVDFVSTSFYVGKSDIIKASGNVAPPADGHAVKFHHVRGECRLDTASMSWYNDEEVIKVVDQVKDILEQWPSTWGPRDQHSVCVLSEGFQVQRIRKALKKRGLGGVHAENLANVQGKQFRAILMTAVQTRDSLQKSHLPGLDLFNDIRVLNTAMTRAQSQVVVVGDAAALCCSGKCAGIWKSYLDHCFRNQSVVPKHFTEVYFERDVKETVRFQKPGRAEECDTFSDAILQELKDEYEQLSDSNSTDNNSDTDSDLSELCENQPGVHMRQPVVNESNYHGYSRPFSNPPHKERAAWESSASTKTVPPHTIVCMFEEEDHTRGQRTSGEYIRKMMIPITKSEHKICILISKKKCNLLPVYEKRNGFWALIAYERLDENLKKNHVFLVDVIKWREDCYFPLGNVVGVRPIGSSLEDGLAVLNAEFKVTQPWESHGNPYDGFSWADVDERENMLDVVTFTVDEEDAQLLDDAISVRDIGDHFELGVHIADVASYLSPGGMLDKCAERQGATYYRKSLKKAIHMIDKDLCIDHLSLLPGEVRRVVSQLFKVSKQTNKIIGKPEFKLLLIRSDKKLSYQKAEEMISKTNGNRVCCDLRRVDDCVVLAYSIAKAQRKSRLVDWAYSQPDGKRLPGNRKARLMIEELNVLFNTCASKFLTSKDKTVACTPLRCQEKPCPEKIEEFKDGCDDFIPLSFHVRHRVAHDDEGPNCEDFCILASVWQDIQSAAKTNDVDKMVDLIAADDIHPQLQPVVDGFRRCCSAAYVILSNSDRADTEMKHYSLNVMSYTQASAPIRRYLDIVVQRLLHSVICEKDVQYTRAQITQLCDQFEDNMKNVQEYDQKAEQIAYAVTITKQSVSKLAFVVRADPNEESFAVSFPHNRDIFPESLSIMYRNLQVDYQPHDESSHSITLKWKRRIYDAETIQIHRDLPPNVGPCVELPLTVWKDTVEAIDEESWSLAVSLIMEANARQRNHQTERDLSQHDHYTHVNLPLQTGDILRIQMTSEISRGYRMPSIQLMHITPTFEICVEHVRSPVKCFSRSAEHPAKAQYTDDREYAEIWTPLCEMESATTAVLDSDSIIIENLVVKFKKESGDRLSGSFVLPEQWIDDWAIECNMRHCLLCIRKRGLPTPLTSEHCSALDPTDFTWVAHGVTSTLKKEKNKEGEPRKVEFYVHHRPMETPACVFQKNTRFTVEIIPKPLPGIRAESAVLSLKVACELVKKIACGRSIPKSPNQEVLRTRLPTGFRLNDSQYDAVRKALKNPFTLIQGPPGTGKTIVGAFLMLCLLDSQSPYKFNKEMKKEVILFCGPSNKSVDVVAEYLLSSETKTEPKALRVYSQQVEMTEYPCPCISLPFSQRKRRPDLSNPKLRSIVLHHRMREDHNPFSSKIRDFDRRIADEEDLTTQEVKDYQKLLRDAREYELKLHDIILCTCTQSSTLSLTKTVNARQILIDESAMATEPQALIPLVCNKPEKIVLIGDHKQLRPIVKNMYVKKLGMGKSLFERYHTSHEKETVMLNIQYRMHVDICEFPSKEFYNGKLRTGVEQPSSVLRVNEQTKPIVFGHVKGTTITQVVASSKGNEKSKANREEREKVVSIARKLVKTAKIEQQSIAILSPYNTQVAEIKAEMCKKGMKDVTVTTFTKSQGSEWRYVIISTVCSLPSEDIQASPDRTWLFKHLGFVGDPNQINVGITRAKEGLCIIGDHELLSCSRTWEKLLKHYKLHSAVTDADKISVRRVT